VISYSGLQRVVRSDRRQGLKIVLCGGTGVVLVFSIRKLQGLSICDWRIRQDVLSSRACACLWSRTRACSGMMPKAFWSTNVAAWRSECRRPHRGSVLCSTPAVYSPLQKEWTLLYDFTSKLCKFGRENALGGSILFAKGM